MKRVGDVLGDLRFVRRPEPPEPPPSTACPICDGAGYLRYDVPIDDPRFGQIVPCECTRRELEQRRIERLVESSNLKDLRDLTFERFILKVREGTPVRGTPDAAWREARAFAERPNGWLVLHGPFGTGKTHLAVAIANYRLSRGEPAIFIVVPDLLDHLRSTFMPSSDVTYDELFETVRNSPMLILDDLGTQTTTAWAQEKLYQILNHRYNKRLPTVITTNLEPDEIEPRIRSRLGDATVSKVIEVRDIDKRRVANARPQEPPAMRPGRRPNRVREDDRV